ncbi:MAG: type I-C CRISPR-associated protein Cas8c/Csd1 [Proteobacteria bacterium]|nr:type I-C CRISPR-associated protein Cas8c/Csd1 [Pseudomonadota bacterium]
MILQALNDYYWRKMADPDPTRRLPALGLEDKEIPFIVELDRDGRLVGVKDTRTLHGKKSVATKYLVPQGVKRAAGVAANLLWDTAEYALGIDTRRKPDRVAEQHAKFRDRIADLPQDALGDEGVRAVQHFLDNDPLEQFDGSPVLSELRESNPVVAFRLLGDTDLICQRTAISRSLALENEEQASADTSICLVTGSECLPARLHTAIKNVWGAQTSGANIVSVNNKNTNGNNGGQTPAFASYNKQQGLNSPVSKGATFAYTTALNHLLAKGSRQRMQVGDASTVFWAQQADPLEDVMASFFGDGDDPDARTEEIRALYESVHGGRFDGGRGNKAFYVLGLAPNAARIAVRFWHADTVSGIAHRITAWFDDLKVARGPKDAEYPSLFRLLAATAVQGKADNIPPNLGGDVMRSVLDGRPFPTTWLNAAVQRCRAEQRVTYLRAAAIKACLNRQSRQRSSISDHKEFLTVLDTTNTNAAYRLGRLFAVLEKIQEEASPGINATIRDRYYGAASSTPVAVFTTLLRLKNAHLKKLATGRVIWFERLLGEVLGTVDNFPKHLPLPDQGRFALGYYHQRQAFFTKASDDATDTTIQGN